MVGICAYREAMVGTGVFTYGSLPVSVASDGSSLSTSTGSYTARSGGLYTITWSLYHQDRVSLFLHKDGKELETTGYESTPDGHHDMGSSLQ